MKKLALLFTAAALLFSLASCDELNDLLTVTFEDVEVEETLNIPTAGLPEARSISLRSADQGETYTFLDSVVFLNLDNAKANDSTEQEEKLEDYIDDITEVELTMLKFTILGMHMSQPVPDFEVEDLTVKIYRTDSVIYEKTFSEGITVGQAIFADGLTTDVINEISRCVAENIELTFKAGGSVTCEDEIKGLDLVTTALATIKAGVGSTLEGATKED